jgi:hypothetical protein
MEELQKNGVYKIRVVNIVDNSVWIHSRVPAADISCLALNKNLKVEVIKLVSMEKNSGYTDSGS